MTASGKAKGREGGGREKERAGENILRVLESGKVLWPSGRACSEENKLII